jgi:hypothetical protein
LGFVFQVLLSDKAFPYFIHCVSFIFTYSKLLFLIVTWFSGIGGGKGCRIFVGNLSYSTTWQNLKDHMRKAGNVKFADVFMDQRGKSKGCG